MDNNQPSDDDDRVNVDFFREQKKQIRNNCNEEFPTEKEDHQDDNTNNKASDENNDDDNDDDDDNDECNDTLRRSLTEWNRALASSSELTLLGNSNGGSESISTTPSGSFTNRNSSSRGGPGSYRSSFRSSFRASFQTDLLEGALMVECASEGEGEGEKDGISMNNSHGSLDINAIGIIGTATVSEHDVESDNDESFQSFVSANSIPGGDDNGTIDHENDSREIDKNISAVLKREKKEEKEHAKVSAKVNMDADTVTDDITADRDEMKEGATPLEAEADSEMTKSLPNAHNHHTEGVPIEEDTSASMSSDIPSAQEKVKAETDPDADVDDGDNDVDVDVPMKEDISDRASTPPADSLLEHEDDVQNTMKIDTSFQSWPSGESDEEEDDEDYDDSNNNRHASVSPKIKTVEQILMDASYSSNGLPILPCSVVELRKRLVQEEEDYRNQIQEEVQQQQRLKIYAAQHRRASMGGGTVPVSPSAQHRRVSMGDGIVPVSPSSSIVVHLGGDGGKDQDTDSVASAGTTTKMGASRPVKDPLSTSQRFFGKGGFGLFSNLLPRSQMANNQSQQKPPSQLHPEELDGTRSTDTASEDTSLVGTQLDDTSSNREDDQSHVGDSRYPLHLWDGQRNGRGHNDRYQPLNNVDDGHSNSHRGQQYHHRGNSFSVERPNISEMFPSLNDKFLTKDRKEELVEAFILYILFRKFSSPAPSFDEVQSILMYERRNVERIRRRKKNESCRRNTGQSTSSDDNIDKSLSGKEKSNDDDGKNVAYGDDVNLSLPRDSVINIGQCAIEDIAFGNTCLNPTDAPRETGGEDPNTSTSPINALASSLVAQLLEGGCLSNSTLHEQQHALLFRLPLHFRLAYLRILIRLLTNETDEEYNSAIRFGYEDKDGGVEDNETKVVERKEEKEDLVQSRHIDSKVIPSEKEKEQAKLKREGGGSSRTSKKQTHTDFGDDQFPLALNHSGQSQYSISFDCLYSIVRFRCGENYINDRVDAILAIVESIGDDNSSTAVRPPDASTQIKDIEDSIYSIGPLCRLLGLLCTAGITPRQLRKMLNLIVHGNYSMGINMHILRALIVATEGSSLAKKLRGKASPKNFFCFGKSGGIQKMFHPMYNGKNPYHKGSPFKGSFGMACWFRVERFEPVSKRQSQLDSEDDPTIHNQTLFKMESGDAASFEVSFKVIETAGIANGFIQYTVKDSSNSSTTSPSRAYSIRSVEIPYPILPRVWFHISIRHVKKSYLSMTKDEVAILFDGRCIKSELLRFPKSNAAVEDNILLGQGPHQPVDITLCSGLDAEAGSLYVFNDIVSDETFKTLYDMTSGIDQSSLKELETSRGVNVKKSNSVSNSTKGESAISNMKQADMDEIFIPRIRTDVSAGSSFQKSNSLRAISDLVGDEDEIGPLLYFMWDPSRFSEGKLLEDHSGFIVDKDEGSYFPWEMVGAKDVIASLGGVQCLLPVLQSLLIPNGVRSAGVIDPSTSHLKMTFPLMFNLLASFFRDKDLNGREWLRCGGPETLESIILQNKKYYAEANENVNTSCIWEQNAFRRYKTVARMMVLSLLDLKEVCSYNSALQQGIYSRLIYNVDLWFGGSNKCFGKALHGILFPTLSCLAKIDPRTALESIHVGPMMNLVREYTVIPPEAEENEVCFDLMNTILNRTERDHIVDVILGIILQILSVEVTVPHLLPLLQFVSTFLDMEWSAINAQDAEKSKVSCSEETRRERFKASEKACTLLMVMMRDKPPGFLESLYECLGDAASWIVCCMVNSYDDKLRSNGIWCFTALFDAILSTVSNVAEPSSDIFGAKRALKTIKNVTGLGQKGFDVSPRVAYKLLWHIIKSHRHHIDHYSYPALLNLLVKDNDCRKMHICDDYVVKDKILQYGYCFNYALSKSRSIPLQIDNSNWTVRNTFGVSAILHLLRFLPWREQERCLFDLLTLVRLKEANIQDIIYASEWQHCLFHVCAGTVEEVSNHNYSRKWKEDSDPAPENENVNHIFARFDLAFQLYALLLGHCMRNDDICIGTLELAASLQRVCVNGSAVFSILLSHVLSNFINMGTLVVRLAPNSEGDEGENQTLTQSAKAVREMDIAQAARHWKKLRHITAMSVAVVTGNGYALVDQFEYRNSLSSVIDDISGGVFGIRINDRVGGISATDVIAETRRCRGEDEDFNFTSQSKDHYRRICTTLSCQVLELLDPFIFPDRADDVARQQGFALIRSIEHRLGKSQGLVLLSLVRLALVQMGYLELSGTKALKCGSMLRCFLNWCLDLIRESMFDDEDAVDRIIICVVLQCHRSLQKCSLVACELETNPDYFSLPEQSKHTKRLFRFVETIGDIVLDAYKGRPELLKECFSSDAYQSLELSLATKDEWSLPTSGKGRMEGLKSFLNSDWVQNFHDINYVEVVRDIDSSSCNGAIAFPEMLNADTPEVHSFMKGLSDESKRILDEYNRALNIPFSIYLEQQKDWADTSAVRDMEYDGNVSINNLASQYRSSIKDLKKTEDIKIARSNQRLSNIDRKVPLQKNTGATKWRFDYHADRLHRRILLIPNRNYIDHAEASYDLALGKERERALKEREERLKKKKEEALAKMLAVAKEGIVKQTDVGDGDDNDDVLLDDTEHDDTISEEREDTEGKEDDVETNVDNASISSDDISIGPVSELEVPPGQLITDWEHIDNDEVVVDDDRYEKGSYLWAKEYVWSTGEKLIHFWREVQIVTIQTIFEGELVLTTHCLYFRPTSDPMSTITKESITASDLPSNTEEFNRRWRLSRVTEVHGRRYMLRRQAIEIFFCDKNDVFINFSHALTGCKDRDLFVSKLKQCRMPLLDMPKLSPKVLNPKSIFKKSFATVTQSWRERKISNFEYLMEVNILSGRTFNDIAQYPVFPWIIADYESDELDLNDPKSFRDLSKPVGALNDDRLLCLIDRYHDLDGLPEEERFLYGSHYSCPGVVLHYLIRQEPFTSMAIDLQSGRFDCPDRLFYDIPSSYKGVLTSTSDVKELIPEMFTTPEILLNTNNFPLGHTQNRVDIGDVKLPKWANGSAYEFVRMHRLALESDYVSSNLHHWIDLIFGYKQRGLEAVKANNVFHFLSYEGSVDINLIADEIDRRATESQIQSFGQTPCQILSKEPHPPRLPADRCWAPIISELSFNRPRRLVCFTPLKQFGGCKVGSQNDHGAAISIKVLNDQIVVVYADLSVATYWWAPKAYTSKSKTPFHLKMDKLRTLPSRDSSTSAFAIAKHTDLDAVSTSCKESYSHNMGLGTWSIAITLGKASLKSAGTGSYTYNSSKANRRGSAIQTMKTKDAIITSSKTKQNQTMDAIMFTTGYYDNTLKAHALDGSLNLQYSNNSGHNGGINCIRLDNDGKILITGGMDGTCRVFTVENPDLGQALIDGYVKTAQGHEKNLFVNMNDDVLMCCHVLWGHDTPISALTLDTDLDVLVSGSVGGKICIHGVRCGKFIRLIDVNDFFEGERAASAEDTISSMGTRVGLKSKVRNLALHKDGVFATHIECGLLQLYTINGVKLSCIDAGEKLNTMEMLPGGHSLVTGGESGHVIIRGLRNLEIHYVLDLSDYGTIHCLSFTPPPLHTKSTLQQFMFVGTSDGSITVVCASLKEESRQKEGGTSDDVGVKKSNGSSANVNGGYHKLLQNAEEDHSIDRGRDCGVQYTHHHVLNNTKESAGKKSWW